MPDRTRRDLIRTFGIAATVPSAATLAGCSVSGQSTDITMQDFTFTPSRLHVDAGSTVEWVNDSDVPHTVTASADRIPEDAAYFASGGFETEQAARDDVSDGLLDAGDTYTHPFDVPGTYAYYCIPHESSGMAGELVVE